MLTEAEVRDMGIPVARDLIGVASGWQVHKCDEWRCQEVRTLTGIGAPAYIPTGQDPPLLPPTYLVAQYVDTVALGVPDAPIRFNGGNSCTWLRQAYVGDVLERSTRVTDVNVREGARGILVIYSLETMFRFPDSGHEVARCGITSIRQYLKGGDQANGGKNARTDERKERSVEDEPNELAFEVHPTSRQLVRYGAATSDFYEAHYDQAFAQSKGLPDVIVHGLFKLGWFAAAAAQGDLTVIHVEASYRRVDLVNQLLKVCRTPIAWGHDGYGVVNLATRQDNGRISTFGRAVVTRGVGWAEESLSDPERAAWLINEAQAP